MAATDSRYGIFRDGRWVESFDGLKDARSAAMALAWGDKKREYSVHELRCTYRFWPSKIEND